MGGSAPLGGEHEDDGVVGVVREVHHRVDVLAAALATAVVHQNHRRADEWAADPARVGAELRDGLRVPIGRLSHVVLPWLVSSVVCPVGRISAARDGTSAFLALVTESSSFGEARLVGELSLQKVCCPVERLSCLIEEARIRLEDVRDAWGDIERDWDIGDGCPSGEPESVA